MLLWTLAYKFLCERMFLISWVDTQQWNCWAQADSLSKCDPCLSPCGLGSMWSEWALCVVCSAASAPIQDPGHRLTSGHLWACGDPESGLDQLWPSSPLETVSDVSVHKPVAPSLKMEDGILGGWFCCESEDERTRTFNEVLPWRRQALSLVIHYSKWIKLFIESDMRPEFLSLRAKGFFSGSWKINALFSSIPSA